MKQIIFYLGLCAVVACQSPQSQTTTSTTTTAVPTHFLPKTGDLLFQDIDCGNFCEAIEKVTQSYGNKRFSHVGLARRKADTTQVEVLEAVSAGVRIVPLDTFLKRSNKVMVGRLKKEYQNLIPNALSFAETLVGKSYDDVFDINNNKYYCSELVYFAFKKANNNQDVFPLAPMTFADPATGKTFSVWTSYYQDLKCKIPEGQPGLNPGGISRSDKINMVHSYEGYSE